MLADTRIKVVLEMLFLSPTNADFQFSIRNLIWRSYISTKALSIARQVEFIDKYKFARIVLYKNSEIFIMYISALVALKLVIYTF